MEAAACVSTLVFVLIPVSPVCPCHVHPGPSYSCTHVHPAKCTPVSLSCLPCLCPCLAREPLGWPLAVGRPWPSWHMSPLTLSMHVPGWGSPLVFLLCVGMCGCMNRIPVSLLAGVCLCMCVPSLIWVSVSVPAWVARVCLDVGGVQGGEGVSVCAPWNPTVYETPLGEAGLSPCLSGRGPEKLKREAGSGGERKSGEKEGEKE